MYLLVRRTTRKCLSLLRFGQGWAYLQPGQTAFPGLADDLLVAADLLAGWLAGWLAQTSRHRRAGSSMPGASSSMPARRIDEPASTSGRACACIMKTSFWSKMVLRGTVLGSGGHAHWLC